jgi:protein ImuB
VRRIAAVALRSILVEVARQKSMETVGAPLAVVLEEREDKDERAVLGNTRITAVSDEAWDLSVRPTMTVASAKARVSDLRVRVVHASHVRRTFWSIAEACLAFGATTALSLDARWNDEEIIWIDVTGCAHLHGPTEVEGERALLSKIEAHVGQMGHACRVAIASGPRIAAAVARYAPIASRALCIPQGKSREAMHRLPTIALPIDARAADWLRSLGLRKIGDLASLPRETLGPRLGEHAQDVMLLTDGDDRAPLRPHVPEVLPTERLALEYGIEHTEQVVFVAKMLCDRIGARLSGRGEGALGLSLELVYDRAFVSPGQERVRVLPIVFPSPLWRASDLLDVLRTRIEASLVRAPIVEVALRADEVVVRSMETRHMFEPEAKAERALPRLCAELAQELGHDRIGTLSVADAWMPRARTVLLPLGARPPKERARLYLSATEPTRLLSVPHRGTVNRSSVVLHTEGIEWWRGAGGRADWVTGWVEEARATALIRVENDDAIVEGWMG